MSSNDTSGCFGAIAIIAAIIGGILLLGEGCKKLGREYDNDPGSVIGMFFLVAGGCAVLYYLFKQK